MQLTTHNSQLTQHNKRTKKMRCTFFVLGWIADKLPHLVCEIQARGHEIASHGNNHELPNLLSLKDLKKDLIGSKKLLEDITGTEVVPNFPASSFFHPWELDPEQPKIHRASFNFKLRHYTSLNKTKTRLKRLIENFRPCRLVTCIEYLNMTTEAGKS